MLMKLVVLVPFLILALSVPLLAQDFYVILVDYEGNPIRGFRVQLGTEENQYIGKVEILRQWILHTKSFMYLYSAGKLYEIKDSKLDRKRGLVYFTVNTQRQIDAKFSLTSVPIESDRELKTAKEENIAIAKIPPRQKTEEILTPLSLATKYEMTGNLELAAKYYEEALKGEPSSEQILRKLFLLNYQLGYFSKARSYLERLPKSRENFERLLGLLIIEGKHREALRLIESYSGEGSANLKYLEGLLHYLNGNRDEAYRVVVELSSMNRALSESLRDLLR